MNNCSQDEVTDVILQPLLQSCGVKELEQKIIIVKIMKNSAFQFYKMYFF